MRPAPGWLRTPPLCLLHQPLGDHCVQRGTEALGEERDDFCPDLLEFFVCLPLAW
ncbi:hypothetical protein ABZY81_38430 [Streptomyces sp. NPDC006514]|uniref:hypothetical protein n=1 Tax=Streptomyces sp. NPDC006514 TaxID=3154308 RepID=UPI0033B0674F